MAALIRKRKTFILPLVVFIAGMVFFVAAKLFIQRNEAYKNIDLRLRSAAESTQLIVNDSMIESAARRDPLDMIRHDSLRNLANKIASIHECVYVYVMIRSGDSAIFVLSSYIESDITNNLVTNYLDTYEEVTPAMMDAFGSSSTEVFDYTNDVWGSFKSIYLPRKTKSGTPYLLCADVRVSEVFDFQLRYIIEFALSALYLILVALPLFLSIRKHLIQKEQNS